MYKQGDEVDVVSNFCHRNNINSNSTQKHKDKADKRSSPSSFSFSDPSVEETMGGSTNCEAVSMSEDSLEGGSGHEDDGNGITVWDSASSADDATVLQFDDAISVDEPAEVIAASVPPGSDSDDEASSGEENSVAAPSRQRSRRLRRGRNYLTYDRIGEPRITRYTLMAAENRPR